MIDLNFSLFDFDDSNRRNELIMYNFDYIKRNLSVSKDCSFKEVKMKSFFVLTILILCCCSEASKHKCRLQFKYAKTCLFYDYDKPNCYPWDTSNCRISKKSHREAKCPFYVCTVMNFTTKILFKVFFKSVY